MADDNGSNKDGENYFPNCKKNAIEIADSDEENDDGNPEPDIGLGSRNRRGLGRKTMLDISSVAGYTSFECRIKKIKFRSYLFRVTPCYI